MIFLRRFLKIVIAAFVVWHMTAIFLYSLYNVEEVPVLEWLYSKRPTVRPYVLATSQWQRWNIFSPDPLRRVIEMHIDQKIDGSWSTVNILNEHSVSWWQRAPELKITRRMEEEKMQPLQERYVHDFCRTQKIAEGTPMRLRKRWHVIPRNDEPQTRTWWNAWEPDWKDTELLETTCPQTS